MRQLPQLIQYYSNFYLFYLLDILQNIVLLQLKSGTIVKMKEYKARSG